MAKPIIVTEVLGLERLGRKLDKTFDPFPGLIKKASGIARERMGEHAKPHAGDKGTLAQAVVVKIDGRGLDTVGRVGMKRSIAGIARTINDGRRPGKAPPLQPLMDWMDSHGISGSPRSLQERIRSKGTKGVEFLEKTEDDLNKKMPGLVKDLAGDIEDKWR